MHHIRRRCGRSAFFFERPAHRLVRERVGVAQLYHAARQQAQRPAPASFRRRRAGQGDEVRLLLAVEPARVDPRAATIRAERGGEALLHEAPPQAFHGGHPTPIASAIRSSGQPGPPAAASALSRTCACLSLRTSALPRDSSAASSSRSAAVIRRRQRHTVPLHCAPPGPSPYRWQPERAAPQITSGRALVGHLPRAAPFLGLRHSCGPRLCGDSGCSV